MAKKTKMVSPMKATAREAKKLQEPAYSFGKKDENGTGHTGICRHSTDVYLFSKESGVHGIFINYRDFDKLIKWYTTPQKVKQ